MKALILSLVLALVFLAGCDDELAVTPPSEQPDVATADRSVEAVQAVFYERVPLDLEQSKQAELKIFWMVNFLAPYKMQEKEITREMVEEIHAEAQRIIAKSPEGSYRRFVKKGIYNMLLDLVFLQQPDRLPLDIHLSYTQFLVETVSSDFITITASLESLYGRAPERVRKLAEQTLVNWEALRAIARKEDQWTLFAARIERAEKAGVPARLTRLVKGQLDE